MAKIKGKENFLFPFSFHMHATMNTLLYKFIIIFWIIILLYYLNKWINICIYLYIYNSY